MNMQNLAALAAIASNGNGGLSSLTGSGKNTQTNKTHLSFYPHHTPLQYLYDSVLWVELHFLLAGLHLFIYDCSRSARWVLIVHWCITLKKKDLLLSILFYELCVPLGRKKGSGNKSHALSNWIHLTDETFKKKARWFLFLIPFFPSFAHPFAIREICALLFAILLHLFSSSSFFSTFSLKKNNNCILVHIFFICLFLSILRLRVVCGLFFFTFFVSLALVWCVQLLPTVTSLCQWRALPADTGHQS